MSPFQKALLIPLVLLAYPLALEAGTPAIAGGYSHTLLLKSDGTVWAAGSNNYGELGDGTTEDRWSPVKVMEGVTAVAAGDSFSLFLEMDGTVWAAGRNSSGQLGDGTTDHIRVHSHPSYFRGFRGFQDGVLTC